MRELDYIKLGMRIRQVRKVRGWSQDVLAKKCGISMSFLGHIERGTRIMSLETLVSVCSALDVGADELLWGVAYPSGAISGMWDGQGKKADDKPEDHQPADNYTTYVRIMKSVAEIMNESYQ